MGCIMWGQPQEQRQIGTAHLVANPQVEVRVKRKRFKGNAETTTDPSRIADFLEYRLAQHPRMVGAMMKASGLPSKPSRTQLEEYALNRALVIIRPVSDA